MILFQEAKSAALDNSLAIRVIAVLEKRNKRLGKQGQLKLEEVGVTMLKYRPCLVTEVGTILIFFDNKKKKNDTRFLEKGKGGNIQKNLCQVWW